MRSPSFPRARRAARHQQRGSTAVEFAFVLPLLLTILFGAIDGGRMVISRCMMSYALTVGARLAVVSSTASVATVQNAVVAAAPLLALSASNVSVVVNPAPATPKTFANRANGDEVQVSITSYTFRPYMLRFLGNKNWSGMQSRMIVE